LKKYSRGTFKMDRFKIEMSGELSPFLRGCIGIGIVFGVILLAGTPFLLALAKALRWW